MITLLSKSTGRVVRVIPENPPDPEIPDEPIEVPSRWGHYGDSQTAGRASSTPTAVSHSVAFQNIWSDSGFTSPTITRNGSGGRSLAGTRSAYESHSYTVTPWLHIQESGGQNNDGQRTASEFGATFQSFMEKIHDDHPDALITYETAFSFGREAQAYRNWNTYNDELRSRVEALASDGITVVIVEADYWIKQLIDVLGYNTVCFPNGDTNAYHYQGIGNFMIALSMFHALGYDVSTLSHGSVLLDSDDKAVAVSLFEGA